MDLAFSPAFSPVMASGVVSLPVQAPVSLLPVCLELTAGPAGVVSDDLEVSLYGDEDGIAYQVNDTFYGPNDPWSASEGDVIKVRCQTGVWAGVSITADVEGTIPRIPAPVNGVQLQPTTSVVVITDPTLPETMTELLMSNVNVGSVVPNPADAPDILNLSIYSSLLTTFPSTHSVPVQVETFDLNGAALTNTALLNIFNAYLVDVEERPALLYLGLDGGTTAVPSGAAATALAALEAALPSATIMVNS